MAGGANPESSSTPGRARPWRFTLVLLGLVLVLVIANIAARMRPPRPNRPARSQARVVEKAPPEAPAKLSFTGSSDKLTNTVVLPTLETTIPAGKSAIWCATLAMAWQEMEKTIYKQRIDFEDGKLGRELSDTPLPALAPAAYYVAAGYFEDGIMDRIRRGMAAKFPVATVPNIDPPPGPRASVAFAYLEASVLFKHQFRHNPEALSFVDSEGRRTPVHAFGIREKDKNRGVDSYRAQVEILFRQGSTFGLDMSKQTETYQVVVARLDRKESLKTMLAEMHKRTIEARLKKARNVLGDESVLLVPAMNWRVEHEFTELRDKHVLNPGFEKDFVYRALQMIQFRLNRKGAEVKSYAHSEWMTNGHDAGPNANFICDGPFLIYLRTRADGRPFFAMWVDNAEVLQRHD